MRSLRELVVLATIGTVALLGPHPGASAGPQPAAPSGQDVAAALQAAADPGLSETLSRFFAEAPGAQPGASAPNVTLETRTIPVYQLTRAFVTGEHDAPAGQLAYQAVPAHASDGRSATVWIVRSDDGQWELGNIASGDQEATLAAHVQPGAKLLHEPQADAWYSLSGDHVRVLDPGRSKLAEGTVQPLHDYQRAVAHRYGSPATPEGTPSPADSTQDSSRLFVAATVGCILLVAVGIWFLLLRTNRRS